MNRRYQLSKPVQRELRRKCLTADEVLRERLGIKVEGLISGNKFFPEETVFIAFYKSKPLVAIVRDGVLESDGKKFGSLSAAAAHYTGRVTTNGWDFWSVRTQGQFLPAHEAAEIRAA